MKNEFDECEKMLTDMFNKEIRRIKGVLFFNTLKYEVYVKISPTLTRWYWKKRFKKALKVQNDFKEWEEKYNMAMKENPKYAETLTEDEARKLIGILKSIS